MYNNYMTCLPRVTGRGTGERVPGRVGPRDAWRDRDGAGSAYQTYTGASTTVFISVMYCPLNKDVNFPFHRNIQDSEDQIFFRWKL